MKQRVRVYKGGVKEEIINKVIEEEARNGWTVKQIIPVAAIQGLTNKVLLLLECPDDEEK